MVGENLRARPRAFTRSMPADSVALRDKFLIPAESLARINELKKELGVSEAGLNAQVPQASNEESIKYYARNLASLITETMSATIRADEIRLTVYYDPPARGSDKALLQMDACLFSGSDPRIPIVGTAQLYVDPSLGTRTHSTRPIERIALQLAMGVSTRLPGYQRAPQPRADSMDEEDSPAEAHAYSFLFLRNGAGSGFEPRG